MTNLNEKDIQINEEFRKEVIHIEDLKKELTSEQFNMIETVLKKAYNNTEILVGDDFYQENGNYILKNPTPTTLMPNNHDLIGKYTCKTDNTTVTCTATGEGDAAKVCNHLHFSVKWKTEGTKITQGNDLAKKAGSDPTRRTAVVRLEYKYDSTLESDTTGAQLPGTDVTVTIQSITIPFVQA